MHLSVHELQDYNPSIAELAENVRRLAKILEMFSNAGYYEDEAMAINARQCVLELSLLADIVARGREEDLASSFARLDLYIKAP